MSSLWQTSLVPETAMLEGGRDADNFFSVKDWSGKKKALRLFISHSIIIIFLDIFQGFLLESRLPVNRLSIQQSLHFLIIWLKRLSEQ